MKLRVHHIREQWDEGRPDEGGDGYWVALRPGYKWAGDPKAAVHCIHEPTKAACYREEVVRCDCADCAPEVKQRADKRRAWMSPFFKRPPRK